MNKTTQYFKIIEFRNVQEARFLLHKMQKERYPDELVQELKGKIKEYEEFVEIDTEYALREVVEMEDLTPEKRKFIMAKLEKILAHTGEGAVNDNEMETANKLAKELMDRYGITEQEILDCDNKEDLIGEELISKSSLQKKKWVSVLSGVIARFYECESVSNINRFLFVGHKLDSAIAAKMFKETHDKIVERSKEVVGMYRESTLKKRTDFCMGAVVGLKEKLDILKEERIRSQNALVVLKSENIENHMRENFPFLLRKIDNVIIRPSSSYYQGKIYGETIGINKEIKA